jgi:hypothetical protein
MIPLKSTYMNLLLSQCVIFQPDYPRVYADASFFRSWIDAEVAANGGAVYCKYCTYIHIIDTKFENIDQKSETYIYSYVQRNT